MRRAREPILGSQGWFGYSCSLLVTHDAIIAPISPANVAEVFFHIAEEFPDHAAIRTGHEVIVYQQLQGRVRAWWGAMVREGIQSGTRLVIAPGAIEERLALMLACLAHGVWFVLPDATWPERRQHAVAADAGAEWAALEDFPGLRRLRTGGLETNLETGFSQEPRSCLFYTGGTTGAPKGVIQTHANILHEVEVHREVLSLHPGDRLSGLYSLSAAGSVRDVFAALLTGACYVHLPLRSGSWDWLSERLSSDEPTIFHAVPPVFRAWSQSVPADTVFPSVRVVFLAGETVRVEDTQQAWEVFPNAVFYTGLGSSEASSLYAHWIVDRDFPVDGKLPVGRPVPGKNVRVMHGEIVVESEFLSPGYWNRPGEDALRFGSITGRRCLFTGDQGYFDESGMLYHAGRSDRRLKVNGGFVDLDELESLIRSWPEVEDARLVAQDEGLAAYLIPAGKEALPDGEARSRLAEEGVSVRMDFIVLSEFPLTVAGKIDSAALPTPRKDTPPPPAEAVSSALEEEIRLIFQEILERPVTDLHAGFQSHGGDSLGLIQLATVLDRRFGFRLRPDEITAGCSVAWLAGKIPACGAAGPSESAWPPEWPAASAFWELPPGAVRVDGFPGYRLLAPQTAEEGAPVVVWLAQGKDEALFLFHLAGRYETYVLPGGALIISTRDEDVGKWLPVVVRELRRWIGGRPVVLGGYCGSGILAVAWAAELERQGEDIRGVLALEALGNAIHCRRWYLVTLGWQMAWRSLWASGCREWPALLSRKFRSLSSRLRFFLKGRQNESPSFHATAVPLGFSLTRVPPWKGPIHLLMSAQAWRWKFLFGGNFGWCSGDFPKVFPRRIRGSHVTCLSVNPPERLFAPLETLTGKTGRS